jgi:antitoxin MazE
VVSLYARVQLTAFAARDYIVITVMMSVKARIIRIGNSRGVRLPKTMLAEAGLSDEVEIRARNGAIMISAAAPRPRAGWAEAAKLVRSRDDDRMLDEPTSTRFDDEEWKW